MFRSDRRAISAMNATKQGYIQNPLVLVPSVVSYEIYSSLICLFLSCHFFSFSFSLFFFSLILLGFWYHLYHLYHLVSWVTWLLWITWLETYIDISQSSSTIQTRIRHQEVANAHHARSESSCHHLPHLYQLMYQLMYQWIRVGLGVKDGLIGVRDIISMMLCVVQCFYIHWVW